MADFEAAYRQMLDQNFSARKKRNSRYSLRAFADFLGVDKIYLSKLHSGDVILTAKMASKFAEKLKLSKEERAKFIMSAAEEQKCHDLYLIDPELTDCDPVSDRLNQLPRRRTKKSLG